MADLKPVVFRGSALDDLRAFPAVARREAGHQIDQVQRGRDPDDWRVMRTVGPGVREIRIRDAAGAFRVVYTAKFADAGSYREVGGNWRRGSRGAWWGGSGGEVKIGG